MRIPHDKHPEILRRAGAGETSDQIAAWLATEGIKVSGRAIRDLLARSRQERGDTAKVVVREELAKSLTGDLHELEQVRLRAVALEQAAMPQAGKNGRKTKGNPGIALKALELQRKVLDTKLHYSGADEPDAAATLADLLPLAMKD